MIRVLSGLLALFVIGFPLLLSVSSVTGFLALVAAVLCAGGIIKLWPPLLTAGSLVALVEYAVALLLSGGPPDVAGALAFGGALSVLVQATSFAARFQGAALHPQVLWDRVRTWLGAVATAAALSILVVVAAGSITFVLPAPFGPALAGVGVLLAFLGVVGSTLQRPDSPPHERMRGERTSRDTV